MLDAALDLFSRQGFARTTVEQVARQAGLSKAAVYLYFPSKDALLTGLVRRAVVPVAQTAIDRMAGHQGDPRPVIRGLFRILEHQLADPTVFAVPALVLREAAAAPEIAAMYKAEVLDRVIPALVALLCKGITEGHIRPVDPELTVRSIVGPVFLHMLLAEVFEMRPEDGLGLESLIENHLTLLFAGLEPERNG